MAILADEEQPREASIADVGVKVVAIIFDGHAPAPVANTINN